MGISSPPVVRGFHASFQLQPAAWRSRSRRLSSGLLRCLFVWILLSILQKGIWQKVSFSFLYSLKWLIQLELKLMVNLERSREKMPVGVLELWWFVVETELRCLLNATGLWGFQSFIRFGSVMLLLIIWSFLSLTSMYCVAYVLVSMVAAGVAVQYLGYTPGIFVVGLFGILILWMYANFWWITGLLLVVGGMVLLLPFAFSEVFCSNHDKTRE
ncbi:chaperone dnaJ-domain containing protein, partial [Trifolium pratense]